MDTEPDFGVRPQTKAQKSRCQKARWVIMSCRPQLFGQRIPWVSNGFQEEKQQQIGEEQMVVYGRNIGDVGLIWT